MTTMQTGLGEFPAPKPAKLAFVFGKESRILQPVSPVLVAFSAILLTTVVLLAVDSFIDAETLTWIYLLPTIVMAMHYGSTVGVLTSFASALAAGYFCFPPKFSFFISDPLNVAELGFFLLLAVIASKAVGGRDEGRSRDKAAKVARHRLVATAEEDRLTACTHKRADHSPVVGVMFPDKTRLRWLLPRLQTKSKLSLQSR